MRKKIIYDVNVGGTRNVAQACLEKGVKRLVHVSSVHVLKEPEQGAIDETLDADGHHLPGVYAKSKAWAQLK